MKRILWISLLAFLTSLNTQAAEQNNICTISEYCKDVCDLKMAGKYRDEDPEHQQMVLHCAEDITKKVNAANLHQ